MISLVEKSYALKTLGDILNNFNGADPSKDLGSVISFIQQIFAIALDIVGMLAVIIILYGAFLYVTAYGDDSKAETAKKTIFWAIIGVVFLALANTLVYIIKKQIIN
jgi:hypothetical protein